MIFASEKASVCLWNLDDSEKTIDRFLSELSYSSNKLDFIKIDLGSIPDNRLILFSCKDTIRKYKPKILINDSEPPVLSFLDEYKTVGQVEGHSLLVYRFS